jgi:hypothetical protein
MAILEAMLQPSVAVGFAAGLVGLRYAASATGTILRPIAKSVVKGALVVKDGVGDLLAESRPVGTRRAAAREHDWSAGVPISVAQAPQPPRRRRASRARASSAGGQRPRARKARSH